MPFTSLLHHIVFATKSRHPWIRVELEPRLHGFVRGVIRNLGATSIAVGSFDDHLHLVADLPAKIAIAEFIGKVKSNSSRFAHDELGISRESGWQDGYGAFSVSRSNLDIVARYVRRQREHHRRFDFHEELQKLLERHGLQMPPQ